MINFADVARYETLHIRPSYRWGIDHMIITASWTISLFIFNIPYKHLYKGNCLTIDLLEINFIYVRFYETPLLYYSKPPWTADNLTIYWPKRYGATTPISAAEEKNIQEGSSYYGIRNV